RVGGGENVQRAGVAVFGELGGACGEAQRAVRVANGRLGRGREQPREARDGRNPVRLQLQRGAELVTRRAELAADAQQAADVVVRLGVRRIEARRVAEMLQGFV